MISSGWNLKKKKAEQAYQVFQQITMELGLALAKEKCVAPSQELVWLGFQIDSARMIVTLPQEKLDKIMEECSAWEGKASASRGQIQSMAGKL